MPSELRWGILSCGMIAHDFVMAMRNCKNPNVIRAVATANSLERAQKFAASLEQFLPTNVVKYGCYEDMLRDENVDCVYIGVLNSSHCEWVCNALQHGKHVLCEKPLCGTVEEAQKIVECARASQRFFMEGWWPRCFPAYRALREVLSNNEFGRPQMISANFCTSTLPDNRTDTDKSECPLNDIGTYLMQFALFCVGDQRPTKAKICANKNEEGVDIEGNICFEFNNGKTKAHLLYSTLCDGPNSAVVCFENGGICEFPEFFNCPTRFTKIESMSKGGVPARQTQHWPMNDTAEYNFANSSGFRYEADHVYECIQGGRTESPFMPWQSSLLLTELTVDLRKQMGVLFPVDNQKS